jgi:hypothetical protein
MNLERNVLVLKAAQQKARFEVLTATSMKMAVFRDVAPCSVVHVDRLLEALTASVRVMVMKAVSSSETSVNV